MVSCLTLEAVLRRDSFVAACSGSTAVSGRQAHTPVDELASGEAAEFLTKFDRCGDDKGLEHVDRCDTGEFCAIAGDDKGSQSLS